MNKQAELAPPRLPKRANVAELDALSDQATYSELLLADYALADQVAEFVTFEKTYFKQMTMQRADLRALRLADVRFEACDLADSSWERLSVSRVELIGCRLIGLQATDGRVEDLLIKGCNAAHAQFWSTVFKRVRFENCNLSETNFQSADLAGVIFDKCDLRGAKMADAKLVGTDLRSSNIDGARVGIKELQGAIVNLEQAVSIARVLGVDVRLD
ncbi:MAG: pentapeptide repeat-containing protein [Roseiflexaceae bacterium]